MMPRKIGRGPCSVEGCGRTSQARGLCKGHWKRWKNHGDPGGPFKPKTIWEHCQADQCTQPVHSSNLGLCKSHARRVWRGISIGDAKATEVVRNELQPFNMGARKLLAKTCPSCGRFLSADWFSQDHQRGQWKTYCRRCNTDRLDLGKSHEYIREAQVRSLDASPNRGKEWTDRELMIVSDPGKTKKEKAALLGRTYYGVSAMMHKLELVLDRPPFPTTSEWRIFWDERLREEVS